MITALRVFVCSQEWRSAERTRGHTTGPALKMHEALANCGYRMGRGEVGSLLSILIQLYYTLSTEQTEHVLRTFQPFHPSRNKLVEEL